MGGYSPDGESGWPDSNSSIPLKVLGETPLPLTGSLNFLICQIVEEICVVNNNIDNNNIPFKIKKRY